MIKGICRSLPSTHVCLCTSCTRPEGDKGGRLCGTCTVSWRAGAGGPEPEARAGGRQFEEATALRSLKGLPVSASWEVTRGGRCRSAKFSRAAMAHSPYLKLVARVPTPPAGQQVASHSGSQPCPKAFSNSGLGEFEGDPEGRQWLRQDLWCLAVPRGHSLGRSEA